MYGLEANPKYHNIVGVSQVRQRKLGTDLGTGHTRHSIPEYPVNREVEMCWPLKVRRGPKPVTLIHAYSHLPLFHWQEAQHQLAQYHMARGQGVAERATEDGQQHSAEAIRWLRAAARNGHGLAAYNLAVANIKRQSNKRGSRTTPPQSDSTQRDGGNDDDDVFQLLHQAAERGIHEAHRLLHMCGHGQCG